MRATIRPSISKVVARKRALHTGKALGTLLAQRRAARSYVADLGIRAGVACAVGAAHAALALVRVKLRGQRSVAVHSLGDAMPKGSV